MSTVYSTETGRLCPDCRQPDRQCRCREQKLSAERKGYSDGVVRLRRETKGRKGSGVTLVDGLPCSDAELKRIAKALKARCGSGGTVRDGIIEIQGDQRETIRDHLSQQGIRCKFAGG
ncbi:MAG: stress response translation initiation inhibitor YciH [Pseudohongiellaceae bacterium]